MKHAALRSVAHNIADSLASGIGLLIGVYEMDVFGEAAKSPEGYIMVDFLSGTTSGGEVSSSLAEAIRLYSAALKELCGRSGVEPSAFRELTARYSLDAHGRHVRITVEDARGRRSTDDYIGMPLKRIRMLDRLGRIRRI